VCRSVAGKCYQGECQSLTQQCKDKFSGFSGNWVHDAANGLSGLWFVLDSALRATGIASSCNSGCGELQCTNTEWPQYCYNYKCPPFFKYACRSPQTSAATNRLTL
jgi:hypothetical protein